jgi:hypothetical protein
MHAERPFTIQSGAVGLLPWGAARLIAARGHDTETSEEAVVVIQEWPAPSGPAEGSRKKEEMERLHLDQFCTDHLLATGNLPYDDIARGSEGVDFTATDVSSGERVGIDLAQFVVEERRTAAALFGRVIDAALERPRRDFSRLAGMVVYMWFRSRDGQPSLPPRAAEAQAAEAIVTALAQYVPDVRATEIPSGEVPQQAPDLGIAQTDFGCSFYAVPMRGAAPASRFFATTGFELALAFQTLVTHADALRTLEKVISDHDRAGVDHLLVTAGAPDVRGATFTSEQFILDFLIEQGLVLTSARQHLRKVALHVWGEGRIIEIFPTERVVSPRMYAAYVPPHFSVQPPPITVVAEGESDGPGSGTA